MADVIKRQRLETSMAPPRMHHAHIPPRVLEQQQQQQQQQQLYRHYYQQRQQHHHQQHQPSRQHAPPSHQHPQQLYDESSYASLQQQLHLQQRQQLQHQRAAAPPPSLYGATTGRLLGPRASTSAVAAPSSATKRRFEHLEPFNAPHFRAQPPPAAFAHAHLRAPVSPPAGAGSPLFASPVALDSPAARAAADSSRASLDSPQSLPGISAMLRRPGGSPLAPAVPYPALEARRTSTSAIAMLGPHRSASESGVAAAAAHSPVALSAASGFAPPQQLQQPPSSAAVAARWSPEMTSISPMETVPTLALSVAPGVPSPNSTSIGGTGTSTTRVVANDIYFNAQLAVAETSALAAQQRSPTPESKPPASSRFAPGGSCARDAGSETDSAASAVSSSAAARVAGGAARAASSGSAELVVANPNKNSRYLREMDRRAILSRIDAGEKQATLAKEYQVSRAAICNLNKHRDEVMSRKDENPLAKHPKKPRPKTYKLKIRAAKPKKLPSPRVGGGANSSSSRSAVHEVKSRAAALLLTKVRNKNSSAGEFRRSSERLLRLLLEEALALVPIKAVEVLLGERVKADGVGCEHPPCAVSIEPSQVRGSPLLSLFRAIEPEQPAALARVFRDQDGESDRGNCNAPAPWRVDFADARQLPPSLQYHNVFVFALSVTTDADAVCCVVQSLLERGAVEAMVSLVVLFVTTEVIREVRSRFPSVRVVAAQVDPSGKQPALVASAEDSSAQQQQPPPPPCCLELVLERFRTVYP